MATLLGHLATFHSFFTQGELLCTGGLAYLLKTHRAASAALAGMIRQIAEVDLPDDLSWAAESRQADTGRVDVEGRTSNGTPLVKIEAKLGALLTDDQLRSYALDLSSRSEGRHAALVLLVPELRQGEAHSVLQRTFSLAASDPRRIPAYPTVAVAVLSWEDVLAALAALDSPECRAEAKQLAGLYAGTCGRRIVPVRSNDELRDWRMREGDFIALVNEATRELTKGRHAVYPMSREAIEDTPNGLDPKGYNRRYVCRSRGQGPCFSIGVRDAFEGPGTPTPIWLRFAAQTSHFEKIRRQIEYSPFAATSVFSEGHLWIPLDVPKDKDGPLMVAALVAQARAIAEVAYATLPPENEADA